MPVMLCHAMPCPVRQHGMRMVDGVVHKLSRQVQAQVIIKSRSERADHEIEKILFTTEQLNEILDDLGRQIGRDYENKPLFVLGILKGGFMFTADLIRHIHPVPPVLEVDFFKAASYGMGIQSSGKVHLDEHFDLSLVKDKHVLVTEDIIDTGLTMSTIVALLRSAGAMSVRVCVLLDKRTRRKQTLDADYIGMVCPDEFVVGYGIDFAERYRWLPYIGVPKPEVVQAILEENARKDEEKKQKEAKLLAQQQQQQQTLNNVLANSNNIITGHINGKVSATPIFATGMAVPVPNLIAKPVPANGAKRS